MIHGLLPLRHPFIDALLDLGGGNLVSAGNSKLMLSTLNMPALCAAILPELCRRLESSAGATTPAAVEIQADGEAGALTLGRDRTLQLVSVPMGGAQAGADVVALPGEMFWRLLLGESGWGDLQPALRERGVLASPAADGLMQVLFPTNEPVYWQADHF